MCGVVSLMGAQIAPRRADVVAAWVARPPLEPGRSLARLRHLALTPAAPGSSPSCDEANSWTVSVLVVDCIEGDSFAADLCEYLLGCCGPGEWLWVLVVRGEERR